MTGLLSGRACRAALDIASSFRSCLELTRCIASSCAVLREDQAFVGGHDDVRTQPSPATSRGQNLVQKWNDQDGLLSVDQSQMKSLLKAAVGLGEAKVPGVTDKLLQLVMSLYRARSSEEEQAEFLTLICRDFGVQKKGDGSQEAKLRALQLLRQSSQPQYASLFVPISNQPGGIKFLSNLRSDVIRASRSSNRGPYTADLRAFSNSLKEALAEWFSVGLLQMERISWDSSPATLLEKVMQSEQVHCYSSHSPWQDLKSRLSRHKRVFGFFHGSMPEEPLVVLHTALMRDITPSIDHILGPEAHDCPPEEAKAAIFYSINSTQRGLAGIDLGNFLIKQAVQKLLQEFPQLEQLSTLSPIPGFSRWLLTCIDQTLLEPRNPLVTSVFKALTQDESSELKKSWQTSRTGAQAESVSNLNTFEESVMNKILADGKAIWEPMLTKLAARYLLIEKRRKYALDPVANFHLRNGAEVFRLNYSACDKTESFGMMVNYRYKLESITANNQAYIHEQKIAVSPAIHKGTEQLLAVLNSPVR